MCILLGFIYYNIITMHGPMNIKSIMLSVTCFEQLSVHHQEDLYMQFQGISSSVLLLQALQLQSLNVLAFSTYNLHLLHSWMQLVQYFIFSFFMSFLMSSSHLFFGFPSGRVRIGFHLYNFFTILSSGIRCKWSNQLNLCPFM